MKLAEKSNKIAAQISVTVDVQVGG